MKETTIKRGLGVGQAALLMICVSGFATAANGVIDRVAPDLGPFFDYLGTLVGWLLAFLIIRWQTRLSWREWFRLTPFPLRVLLPLVLTVAGATVLVSGILFWILPHGSSTGLARGGSAQSAVAEFITWIILAPLLEEFFFRGWMLRGFLSRYAPGTAIFLSALFFSVIHLVSSVPDALISFPMGLFFGWLFYQTGSLGLTTFAHGSVNFTSQYVIYPLLLLMGYSPIDVSRLRHFPLLLLTGGFLATVAGFFILHSLLRAASPEQTSHPQTTPYVSD